MLHHPWFLLLRAGNGRIDLRVGRKPVAVGDAMLEPGAPYPVEWGNSGEVLRAKRLYERRAVETEPAWMAAHYPSGVKYMTDAEKEVITPAAVAEYEAALPVVQPEAGAEVMDFDGGSATGDELPTPQIAIESEASPVGAEEPEPVAVESQDKAKRRKTKGK